MGVNDYISAATVWAEAAHRVRVSPDEAARLARLWSSTLHDLDTAAAGLGVGAVPGGLFDTPAGRFSRLVDRTG